ncbi:MAG: multicopper oxidase family protein [Pseudomonadota bacterium]
MTETQLSSNLMTRRRALALGAGGLAAAAMTPFAASQAAAPLTRALTIQGARYPVRGPVTDGLFSLSPDAPPPVLRLRRGVEHVFDVTNATADYTTVHWHGLRVPNAMDGVPYLTQVPIAAGETFSYRFASPDAGTFWYHPHCMTMEQMAKGLTGLLVVEEDRDPGFDADLPLVLKDFRLNDDGTWQDLWTRRGAARGGTTGAISATNWDLAPVMEAPAGGLARLRLAATDISRIYRIYLPDARGAVVALDGHPLPAPAPLPTKPETALALSPGQRADIAVMMPPGEGQMQEVLTRAPGTPRTLARLTARGANRGRRTAEIAPLPANPVPMPDLSRARLEEFVFGWSPDGTAPNNGWCGTLGYTFWSINRTPWPGDAAPGVGPLATWKLGDHVVLRLRNESPNDHPIHLHGLLFRPLRSNKRPVRPHPTDTALLLREETLDVALIADNPGDWAFHCHIIEHQKTGLAGFIRVES